MSSTHVAVYQQVDSAVHNNGKHRPLDFCMDQMKLVQQLHIPNYKNKNLLQSHLQSYTYI